MNSYHSTNRLIAASFFMLILLAIVINASFFSLRHLAQIQHSTIPSVLGEGTGAITTRPFDHSTIDGQQATLAIAFDEHRTIFIKDKDAVYTLHSPRTLEQITSDGADLKWYGVRVDTSSDHPDLLSVYADASNRRVTFLAGSSSELDLSLYDPAYFIDGVRTIRTSIDNRDPRISALHPNKPVVLVELDSSNKKDDRRIAVLNLDEPGPIILDHVDTIQFDENQVRYTTVENNGGQTIVF